VELDLVALPDLNLVPRNPITYLAWQGWKFSVNPIVFQRCLGAAGSQLSSEFQGENDMSIWKQMYTVVLLG
jgi:hypothetical protein